MVVVSAAKPKAWLFGMRVPRLGFGLGLGLSLGFGTHGEDRPDPPFHDHGGSDPRHLGILAFEAARTMSHLVSLHRALSDAEVARVRSDVIRSEGVAYLNSNDQAALLRLACAEMVNELDAAAAAVSRLGTRCRGVWPLRFEHAYAGLKEGEAGEISQLGMELHLKDVEKKVKKMERYVASTSALHEAMEDLAEMEAGEQRRLGKWRQCAGAGQTDAAESPQKRLSLQRDKVRHLREVSLWSRNFDKVTELMASFVVSIFARICFVYGSSVLELPQVIQGRHGRVEFGPVYQYSRLRSQQHHHVNNTGGIYMSGPLERPAVGNVFIRNSGPILRSTAGNDARSWTDQALEAPANTLGASGLALRYAKVVTLLDELAKSPEGVPEGTRQELYWMLPDALRAAVGVKLRAHRRMDDGGGRSEALACGWREAGEAILGWLAPVAHDTVRWHSERSFEQRQPEPGPRVLMLQTLMFSDREKAEAAIVELLVAFSCVCRYGPGAEGRAES